MLCLARSTCRHVPAGIGVFLSTGDADAGPGPAGAAACATENVDVSAGRGDGARDALDGETGDGDAGSRGARGLAVLAVLLNDNAVLGNVLQRNVLVRHARDGARRARDRLDAHAVVRIDDRRARYNHVLDRVVGPPAYRANRDAVAA